MLSPFLPVFRRTLEASLAYLQRYEERPFKSNPAFPESSSPIACAVEEEQRQEAGSKRKAPAVAVAVAEIGAATPKRRKSEVVVDERDWINDLPECLLIHIFSFLPMVDAYRASFVSRGWRNLWKHSPSLDFVTNIERIGADGVYDFVDKMLKGYQGLAVRSFQLQIPIKTLSCPSKVDRLMSFAMKRKVEELTLSVSSGVGYSASSDLPKPYPLTFYFHRLRKLHSLTLVNCNMDRQDSRYYIISFPWLKTLSFIGVHFSSSMLKEMMLGSPLLEELSISDSFVSGRLVIMDSREQLKCLSIRGSSNSWRYSIDIHAPKLLHLECTFARIHIKNLASLITARMEASPESYHCSELGYHYREMLAQSLIGLSHAKELNLKGPFLQVLGKQKKESLGMTSFNVRSFEFTTTKLSGIEVLGLAKMLTRLHAIVSLKVFAEEDTLGRHYNGGVKKIDLQECWRSLGDSLGSLQHLGTVEVCFSDSKWIRNGQQILDAKKFIKCRQDEIKLVKCVLKSLKHLKRLTITTPREILHEKLKCDILSVLKCMLSSCPKASPDAQIVIT